MLEDFGREVGRRARHCRGIGIVMEFVTGAEIAEDDAAARFLQDVLGLDVTVDEAGAMHGRERAAQLDADAGNLLRRERSALGELGLERPAFDELHPEAGAAVDALGAVDSGDVRMTHARHQPAFVYDEPVLGAVVVAEQLQRDVAIEARVPGAIDVAEAAAADLLVNAKGTPGDRNIEGAQSVRRPPCGQNTADAHRRLHRELRIQAGGVSDDPKLANVRPFFVGARVSRGRVPVWGVAVGHGLGQRGQSVICIRHGHPCNPLPKHANRARANRRWDRTGIMAPGSWIWRA